MTQTVIDDVIPRTQLIAASGQTVFNTNWTADATTDILVYVRADGVAADDETQLVSSTDYVVTFIGGSETVRVTFNTGLALDDIVTIVRNTPAERLNLYVNTNFTPSMLNEDFGILTLVDQQAQMYDTAVTPHYNLSELIENPTELASGDLILPRLTGNQIWAKNPDGDAFIPYNVPEGGGIAPSGAKYIIQSPDVGLPNAQSMSDLASGIVVSTNSTGVQLTRTINGTAEQIVINNGNGIAGNPTASIADNAKLPGDEGIGLPSGTTAERPSPPVGTNFRFNTDLIVIEYWDGSDWVQLIENAGVVTAEGTENQVLVNGTFGSPMDGPVVLTTPQDIGPTSSPSFQSVDLGAPLSPASGGTGVDNGTSTLTLDADHVMSGAFESTFNFTADTNVTFPVSGTLATTSQIPVVVPSAFTSVDDANVTLTLSGSPSNALLEDVTATVGWSGLLPINRGGTGVSLVTTAPTASSFAGWDGNVNFSSNNFISGFATTITSGGTLVLTAASAGTQEFTGTQVHTVTLPVVSTLVRGFQFKLINNSSGAIAVNSSGGNLVVSMAADTTAFVTCVAVVGTGAASWNSSYLFDNGAGVISITGTANQVIASSSTGNVVLSLPQNINTTANPVFAGFNDSNANRIMSFVPTTSSVNYLSVYNAATAFPPQLVSAGTDTDIAMYLVAKGNKPVTVFGGAGGTLPFNILSGTGYQHVTNFNFANTAQTRNVTFPDATGTVLFNNTVIPPTIQKFTSGSGTYTTPTSPAPLYIRVLMVGGGSGAPGSGTGFGSGTNGGDSTFGSSLLFAGGGIGPVSGGTASLGSAIGIAVRGGIGGGSQQMANGTGGQGGSSYLGGAGSGGPAVSFPGSDGYANSGSGGGGAGGSTGFSAAPGGSSGGYVDAIITSPASSYVYSVGTGGSGGAAGTAGGVGGSGGSGLICVYEYYQ